MFLVTAVLTSVGAVVPGAVAIMAPIGLSFAARHRINPLLMGLLVINGASAGGFSPIGVFGVITNGVVERESLASNPGLLWASTFLFNLLLCFVVFFLFGGRDLIGHRSSRARTWTRGGRGGATSARTRGARRGRGPTKDGAATATAGRGARLNRSGSSRSRPVTFRRGAGLRHRRRSSR